MGCQNWRRAKHPPVVKTIASVRQVKERGERRTGALNMATNVAISPSNGALSIKELEHELTRTGTKKDLRNSVKLMEQVKAADVDQSGEIDAKELVGVVKKMVAGAESRSRLVKLLWLAAGIIAIQTGLNVVAVVATTVAYKDQYMNGDTVENGA